MEGRRGAAVSRVRIACDGVSLSYDGVRRAESDGSFIVAAGSIFARVGPNDAGKTSTLRMGATLTPPSSGRIVVDGLDATRDPRVCAAESATCPIASPLRTDR